MILKFDERRIDVNEEYVESTVSKSTGKNLNTYKFEIIVKGKDKFEEFKDMINRFREQYIYQIDEEENVLAEYNVETWNYRFFNEFDSADINYSCDVEIKQVEELKTDKIIIEGIENEVLKYKEEYDTHHKAIIIKAIIKNTEEQRELINDTIKDKDYFDVVRPGVSDDTLKMRFGKTTWSEHEGFIKRNIVLVEKTYDENNSIRRPIFWPEKNNMMMVLAKNVTYVKKLEDILLKSGVITTNNIEEINKLVDEEYEIVYRDYYKVEDAEEDFD